MDDLEKKVFSKLSEDNSLMEKGCILTNPNGSLKGIVDSNYDDKAAYSGYITYTYYEPDNSLDISYITNNYKVNTELKKYKSNKARKKGLLTLFNTYLCIAEMAGMTKLAINTWIISARPNLLKDTSSFFYKWKPENKKYHSDAVKENKGIEKLRDQMSLGSLVQYYKCIKINNERKKFDIQEYLKKKQEHTQSTHVQYQFPVPSEEFSSLAEDYMEEISNLNTQMLPSQQ